MRMSHSPYCFPFIRCDYSISLRQYRRKASRRDAYGCLPGTQMLERIRISIRNVNARMLWQRVGPRTSSHHVHVSWSGDMMRARRFRYCLPIIFQSNSFSTRSLPWRPSFCLSSSSWRRFVTDCAMVVHFSGSMRIPLTPSATASGIPPTVVATTGLPAALASNRTIPNPSVSPGTLSREGQKCHCSDRRRPDPLGWSIRPAGHSFAIPVSRFRSVSESSGHPYEPGTGKGSHR